MDNVLPFKRPVYWDSLRADEAENIIRERAEITRNIILTNHAEERMAERDILYNDMLDILRTGSVDCVQERNEQGDWTVMVSKRMRGTRNAGVITIILKETEGLVIRTVEWIDV